MKSNVEYCDFLGCYADLAGEIGADISVGRTVSLSLSLFSKFSNPAGYLLCFGQLDSEGTLMKVTICRSAHSKK
jgi:hypothetical protein